MIKQVLNRWFRLCVLALLAGCSGQSGRPGDLGGAPDCCATDSSKTITLERGALRIIVDKVWGGAIREVWYDGQNLINNHDGGRLLGISLYDGSSPTGLQPGDPDWGWNPTPSDKYNHANPPLDYSISDGVLHVKARNLQWNPDNKGGGAQQAVPSDVVIESRISILETETHAAAFEVDYTITHEGAHAHMVQTQEAPFAYVRRAYRRRVIYSGATPWQDGAVDISDLQPFPPIHLGVAPERWGALVDDKGHGLTVWAPHSYPLFRTTYFDNPTGGVENPTSYSLPLVVFSLGPNESRKLRAYFFAGSWIEARAAIYQLHKQQQPVVDMPPFGSFDKPVDQSTGTGQVLVSGWVLDDAGVSRVAVLVDGKQVDLAPYGNPRPDVAADYPGLPNAPNHGFRYFLDSTTLKDGAHQIEVRVTDSAGAVESLGTRTLNISNP